MKNILLKSLLKAKKTDEAELEDAIEAYLRDVKTLNKQQTEEFVSDLLVYIMQNFEKLDSEQLLAIVMQKIDALGYTLKTDAIEAIYEKSAVLAAAEVSAAFVFDKEDARVIESTYRALAWLKNDGTANTQEKIKQIIVSAMEGDVNMADLGETLRSAFEGVVDESARYFEGVSDHIIRQSQSLTRVQQFAKAGVDYVKVVAVIDSVTSATCRSLHGKVIKVSDLLGQADAITAATTIEEKKKASRWQSAPIFSVKLPDGVGMPPYHFRCRTIVVAYFPQNTDIDGKKANGSYIPWDKYNGKEVLFSQQDPFGYERVVTAKTFDHGGTYHGISKKTVLAGLKTLKELAQHRTEPGKEVGWSEDHKLFFVFKDGEVWTVYNTSNKNYFKDNAEPKTIASSSMKKGADNENI